MNDEFDDLDRALFALPLEAPPPGLRDSILRATIYAPVAEPAFRPWEIAAIGAALAVAVWLGILLATDRALGTALTTNALALGHAFADPATLTWLSVGGGIATWLTFAGSAPLRLPIRNGRA
jgi:hypothetical protein